VLGSHEKPIKCIEFSNTTGLVISGSWDCSVALWDPRTSKSAGSVSQAGCKVYSMDIVENRIVVATSGRSVFIYDIRNLGTPEQVRESSLMNQTRCIRSFPDGTGYALSSIEGRVAVEYFDPSPQIQKKKYAFKCHRKIINGSQTLYPVNSMAFHPKYGTFATGGCDALINVWDGRNKKRICQYPPYPTSIAALDFNSNGSFLQLLPLTHLRKAKKNILLIQFIFGQSMITKLLKRKGKHRQPKLLKVLLFLFWARLLQNFRS